MSDKSFPLGNPNIFVKCLRRSHTVTIGNDFPAFCSLSVLKKTQNHPSLLRRSPRSRKQNQSVAWYACEAVLGKEKYDRHNGRKTGTSVP